MSKVIRKEQCPNCAEQGGDTHCDNLIIFEDGSNHCFACEYHLNSSEIMKQEQEAHTFEYLPHRCLSKSTLQFYGIKTEVDGEGKPINDIFKYPWGSEKIRNLEEKDFRWEPVGSVKPGLFGRDKFAAGEHKYVTITEGEYDAASLYQVLGSSVVSVQSSGCAVRDVVADRPWVDAHERIYLALDNDIPGREALKNVARLFDYNKVWVVDFDKWKDANEVHQEGGPELLRTLWMNAKRYLPETVIEINKSNILELLKKKPVTWGIPYPFPTLNEMTYGLRRGESVLITAPEGVGKTQFMHAIEHQLLKETDDAIGPIFLEEDQPDHLRALGSIALKKPANLPDSGCTDADVEAAVARLIKTDGRVHLYSHFGSDDPDVLLDTIRFMVTARNVVWVLLDHIGICVSGLRDEKDERRALDYISTRLAMMIKELNFGLIFVSHVNDNGLTRGSRLISKDCHVRIDLSRDILAGDNVLNLMVSKNRPTRKTGSAGRLRFDTFTSEYTEIGREQKEAA